ncbi:hypothetical protein MC885_000166, partial [Smutsia gigantea]
MAYGSASQLLKTYFPEGMASHILISGYGLVTLCGLSHLHSLAKHGQRHRAVCDFSQFSTSVQPWLSLELRQDLHGYNVKSDIYSVGITAYELTSGTCIGLRFCYRNWKLKGPPYSPLDISIFPQPESRMKNSRSGIDSGTGDSIPASCNIQTTSQRIQLHTAQQTVGLLIESSDTGHIFIRFSLHYWVSVQLVLR